MISIILNKVGYLLSFIYTRNISKKLNFYINVIYTGWLSRHFMNVEGRIEYPIRLDGAENISIGKNVLIQKDAHLATWNNVLGKKYTPSITIGEGTVIQRNCFLSAINKIEIGKNVAITERTLIVDNVHGEFRDHKFTFENGTNIPDVFLLNARTRPLASKGPVIIEDDVHIGMNSVILPGVIIGHNSIIANNSVVSKRIPPYSIVAGNPAQVILTFGR